MNRVRGALFAGRRPHSAAGAAAAPHLAAAAASFHSTRALERKQRKSAWHNSYAKRKRNRESRRTTLQNISEYAKRLFQTWREEDERDNASSEPSWFRGHRWVRRTKTNDSCSHTFYSENFRRGRLEFCTSDDDDDDDDDDESEDDDDEEPETIFRDAFRGSQFTYWTFGTGNFRWSGSSRRAHSESSRNWSFETDDEYETSARSEVSSARQTLGLRISGPVTLEEVKNAYRACALKWHPDRHHGSSKAAAGEKFKQCSAAYKTLCDSLASA